MLCLLSHSTPTLEEEGAQVDHVKMEMNPEEVERLKSWQAKKE
jgi:hypothetical protein